VLGYIGLRRLSCGCADRRGAEKMLVLMIAARHAFFEETKYN